MRRRVAALVMAGAMAMSLLGAGNVYAADDNGASVEYAPDDTKGEITIYCYYGESSKVYADYAVEKMEELHPDLKINIEPRTDSDGTALKTWAAVGELPDIFQVVNQDLYDTLRDNGDLYQFDSIVDETNYYDNIKNGDKYKENFTDEDGHQYSVGSEITATYEVFYNISLLKELGLECPTNYDEFKNCVKVLKENGKIPVALAGNEQWFTMGLYDMAVIAEGAYEGTSAISKGDSKFADNEAYTKAADKIQELIDMGAFGSSPTSTTSSQAVELMSSGQAGFTLAGTWQFDVANLGGYADNCGWVKNNIFADAGKEDEISKHRQGGAYPHYYLSANANPTSGLDADTVGKLAMEFNYYYCEAPGTTGTLTTVGDFEVKGSDAYMQYADSRDSFETFTDFTYAFANTDFVSQEGNALDMMLTGNSSAEDFIKTMEDAGF